MMFFSTFAEITNGLSTVKRKKKSWSILDAWNISSCYEKVNRTV